MNTTSGKVRLATYEEVKKMASNNAGGKLVWSYASSTGDHSAVIPVDFDYVAVYSDKTYNKNYLAKGYNTIIVTNNVYCTVSLSDNKINCKIDNHGTNYGTTLIFEAYKYD